MTDPQSRYDFELDQFQVEAIAALDRGESVLVAAPTGAGKTVVAEHAIARALEHGNKAFYTTPIKALSNQKMRDLSRIHGPDTVGLLTGDHSLNGDAPVVVMTTEVLRNMIYAGSSALEDLEYVVLDEVHYLQDEYRGPVWEEVIIHLAPSVRLVCLSATVSNADEVADWISTLRGPTATILETQRPVDLSNLYCVGERGNPELQLLPTLVDGEANREADRFDADRPIRQRRNRRQRQRRRFATPRRLEVVERLEADELLPAIYFIFSRAGCEEAVATVLNSGLTLTSIDERDRIEAIVREHTRRLDDADLEVLGVDRFRLALMAGVAAHHAGMVPPFKEAVEACFVEGLVRVVFATETLALGINMPARTVVIEKLTKFTGEHHAFLSPAEYTQLTGRAGRRGIDEQGQAVVLWSRWVRFGEVAALASSRAFRLTSSFRPTYNMAANLIARYTRDQARQLLNRSFAQYQADADVVRMEARLSARRDDLTRLRSRLRVEPGEIEDLRRLEQALEESQSSEAAGVAIEVREALRAIRPGDVLRLDSASGLDRVAVLSVAQRRGGTIRVRVVTQADRMVSFSDVELTEPPLVIGHIELPAPYAPNRQTFRSELAARLRAARLDPPNAPDDSVESQASTLREQLHSHPLWDAPDRREQLRYDGQRRRAEREIADLEQRLAARSDSVARDFERVVSALTRWRYVDGWSLTTKGAVLSSIYHESDLLVAETVCSGMLDGLEPAELAGLVSCLTYEHRSPLPAPSPWFPNAELTVRFEHLEALAGQLNDLEQEIGLPRTRMPDGGFSAMAHAWAIGLGLDDVLADEDLSGGDFVRNVKQLVDLLRQIGDVTRADTARAARRAAEALDRGVVASAAVPGVAENYSTSTSART